MRLHIPPPPIQTIRLTFRKQGYNYEYLMLEFEEVEKVKKSLEEIIVKKVNLNPFSLDKRVAIDIREYKGAKAGKSSSISFKADLSPIELKEVVLNSIVEG